MTPDPIRSALAAAGCTREDARKIAAFLRALPDADMLSPPIPAESDEVGIQHHKGTLHALAAAIEEAARDA